EGTPQLLIALADLIEIRAGASGLGEQTDQQQRVDHRRVRALAEIRRHGMRRIADQKDRAAMPGPPAPLPDLLVPDLLPTRPRAQDRVDFWPVCAPALDPRRHAPAVQDIAPPPERRRAVPIRIPARQGRDAEEAGGRSPDLAHAILRARQLDDTA